jgi:hypothetical protein
LKVYLQYYFSLALRVLAAEKDKSSEKSVPARGTGTLPRVTATNNF